MKTMKNREYKSCNGLTMVESSPFNWQKQTIRADDDPKGGYFYSIYVGNMLEGHICNYDEETGILSIAYTAYSSDDPSLKFKVDNIEEAGRIVEAFAKGMENDLKDTIYTK